MLGAIIYRLIVSGAAPAEAAAPAPRERVEVREPEYRDRGEYRSERAEYRDRGEYRDDYRGEYRDYRDERY